MAKVVFSAVSSSSRNFESVTAALSDATFVAFNNASGVYPDVLVWERTESGWTPVAWRSDAYFAGEISGDDLELELLTQDGTVLFGENCSREQFYEVAFGTDAFAESAFADSDPEELGFESDIWFPGRFEAPGSLMTDNGYLVEYHAGLSWTESELEVREDLEALNETVHVEMYGHSYRA